MKKVGQKFIKGTITCLTGLHIGGSREEMEIGGVDMPVIKHPVTREPYIPGSSLKGKMRCEVEREYGKFSQNGEEPCGCGEDDCMVCKIFGPHKNPRHRLGPTRIIVRDAVLNEESRKTFQEAVRQGASIIERKTENIINRRTSTAQHPRTCERVVPGTKFDFEIVIQFFENDDQEKIVKEVEKALKKVEATYLGGCGSRGYGKIKFDYKIVEER